MEKKLNFDPEIQKKLDASIEKATGLIGVIMKELLAESEQRILNIKNVENTHVKIKMLQEALDEVLSIKSSYYFSIIGSTILFTRGMLDAIKRATEKEELNQRFDLILLNDQIEKGLAIMLNDVFKKCNFTLAVLRCK